MMEYHKIQTVFKRDMNTKHKTLIDGEYSLPEFEYLKDNKWVFTEKVDGTNIRVIGNCGNFEFRGKTDRATIPVPLLTELSITFNRNLFDEVFCRIFPVENVCLYGEGYGPKIQGGGKYRSEHGFVLFDVNVDGWWLKRADIEDVANKLGIDVVPVIGEGTLADMVTMARLGFLSEWGEFTAEGIVARPSVELKTRGGNRIITKIKHKDFA